VRLAVRHQEELVPGVEGHEVGRADAVARELPPAMMGEYTDDEALAE
jgi:hypothetical protein